MINILKEDFTVSSAEKKLSKNTQKRILHMSVVESTLKKICSSNENYLNDNLKIVKKTFSTFVSSYDSSIKQFDNMLEEIEFGFKYLKDKMENIPKILKTIEAIYEERNDQKDESEKNLKIRTRNTLKNRKIFSNEKQLRLFLEDRWIESEYLYEALKIHKEYCCDRPSLYFEEDKHLFQQEFELKKEKNIDLMLKKKAFPHFNSRFEHPINKILCQDSQSFKTYSCFGQRYFEKYEKEMDERKKYSSEQELIELRKDFTQFYHGELDYMSKHLIFKQLRKY